MADKKLAQRIIDLREAANIKQAELGRSLGLDCSATSKIESGPRKVSSDELAKLSEIFSVTTDYRKNSTPVWANKKDTNG